jgi:hypothetical protein
MLGANERRSGAWWGVRRPLAHFLGEIWYYETRRMRFRRNRGSGEGFSLMEKLGIGNTLK